MTDDTRREHRVTADRETIREWVEAHDVVPARRRRAGESEPALVPRSEADEHERLDWEEFYDEMEQSNRVVVYEESGEGGLDVRERERAMEGTDLDRETFEERLVEGEVVTGQVTETTVVETTVVEEAELESELVDTELVDERIVDVELSSRECTTCDLVEANGAGETDWFDADHYLASRGDEGIMETHDVDVSTAPYRAELDVEERYRVTRELVEQFTIETRITDVDVAEMDTVGAQDIDVEGLHRELVGGGYLEVDDDPDAVATDYDAESEFVEDDTIHTYFNRRMTVEDDVVDRKRLRTEISDVADHGMELVESRTVETTMASDEGMRTSERATMASGTEADEEYRTTFHDSDEGKDVVNAAGDEVGMVVDVDEEAGLAYVDPDPGITETIMSSLGWGDHDEEDYPLGRDQVRRITDDAVELREGPEVDEV